MLKNETLKWLHRCLLFAGLLLIIVVLTPKRVISQDGFDKPLDDRPFSGDPGPAAPPDLALDDPSAEIQVAIAEASDISAQALGSPVIVSPASFLSTNFNNDFRFIYSGFIYSNGTAGTSVCSAAPVDLPHGAIIKGVTAFAFDNDAAHDIGFWLIIKDFKSTAPEIFSAEFSSTGANIEVRSFTDVTITQPVVDNSTNIYFIYTCLRSGNHRLYAMQVDYTQPTFLPLIVTD